MIKLIRKVKAQLFQEKVTPQNITTQDIRIILMVKRVK